MIGELGGKAVVGLFGLGGDHDPGGVLIEPVDDSGAFDPADAAKALAAMMDEGIDQRAVLIAGGGVHDHASGLVDDDQMLVLIEDVQRNGLGLGFGLDRFGGREGDGLAGLDAIFGHFIGRSFDADRTR